MLLIIKYVRYAVTNYTNFGIFDSYTKKQLMTVTGLCLLDTCPVPWSPAPLGGDAAYPPTANSILSF